MNPENKYSKSISDNNENRQDKKNDNYRNRSRIRHNDKGNVNFVGVDGREVKGFQLALHTVMSLSIFISARPL